MVIPSPAKFPPYPPGDPRLKRWVAQTRRLYRFPAFTAGDRCRARLWTRNALCALGYLILATAALSIWLVFVLS